MARCLAYVGLEMAMVLIRVSVMSDYWSSNIFFGHDDF